MCFSPEADVVGGLLVGAVGIDALLHVRRRHDHLAFAVLPLLLGAHQLTEAFVWWGLRGEVPSVVEHLATWIYLLFAFVVLPVYVPAAIRALEPPGPRKSLMTVFIGTGVVVSAVLLIAMIRGPVTAHLGNAHIGYRTELRAGLLITGSYIVATCGAAIVSGYRWIAAFGCVNLIAVAALARLTIDGFASLWCGWAALTSLVIAWHLRATAPRASVGEALS